MHSPSASGRASKSGAALLVSAARRRPVASKAAIIKQLFTIYAGSFDGCSRFGQRFYADSFTGVRVSDFLAATRRDKQERGIFDLCSWPVRPAAGRIPGHG